MEFYQYLFKTSAPIIPANLENLIEPKVSVEDNAMLTCILDEHEILATLKMHPEKALGLDGMTTMFFIFFLGCCRDRCCPYSPGFFQKGRVDASSLILQTLH